MWKQDVYCTFIYFVNDFGKGRNRHLSDCLHEQIPAGCVSFVVAGGGGLRSCYYSDSWR